MFRRFVPRDNGSPRAALVTVAVLVAGASLAYGVLRAWGSVRQSWEHALAQSKLLRYLTGRFTGKAKGNASRSATPVDRPARRLSSSMQCSSRGSLSLRRASDDPLYGVVGALESGLFTSPLMDHFGQRGIFVGSDTDWENFGHREWRAMLANAEVDLCPDRDPQPCTNGGSSHGFALLGVDTEWFKKNPTALVQIASRTHCFIFHLSYLSGRVLPPPVVEALASPTVIKSGVGITGDAGRLQREQNLFMMTAINIEHFASMLELGVCGRTGLSSLMRDVLCVPIEKNPMVSRSNWELRPLEARQVSYAADDAVASFELGKLILGEFGRRHASGYPDTFLANLRRTVPLAAAANKRAQKHLQALNREKILQANNEERVARGRPAKVVNAPQPAESQEETKHAVRVLNKEGVFIFTCSMKRTLWYIKDKNLATITEYKVGLHRKPAEIKLIFDPKARTKLCVTHACGGCEVGDNCPYAHGVDQLTPEVRALLHDPDAKCCSFCLATNSLMRHSIVPPSFRRFLPCDKGSLLTVRDFVPICLQCNSRVRTYYDVEICCMHDLASQKSTSERATVGMVTKCVMYARLLLSEQAKLIPENRQLEMKALIASNWKLARLHEAIPLFEKRRRLKGEPEPCAVEDDPTLGVSSAEDITNTFLERMGAMVPGEVIAYDTMMWLVGSDKAKAQDFVQHWRDFCRQTCKIIERVLPNANGDALNATADMVDLERIQAEEDEKEEIERQASTCQWPARRRARGARERRDGEPDGDSAFSQTDSTDVSGLLEVSMTCLPSP